MGTLAIHDPINCKMVLTCPLIIRKGKKVSPFQKLKSFHSYHFKFCDFQFSLTVTNVLLETWKCESIFVKLFFVACGEESFLDFVFHLQFIWTNDNVSRKNYLKCGGKIGMFWDNGSNGFLSANYPAPA